MATPDERLILQILEEEGGESSVVKVCNQMGLRLDYGRTILGSMGRRDLIDLLAGGKVRMAEKGWMALGKTPGGSPYHPQGAATPEPPEEKYRRWLSR